MSLSQIVRTESGLANDIIAMNKALADTGVPAASLGVIGNTYIDTVSGIQYQKEQSGWVSVVDIASVGPPFAVPDPLTLNNGLFVNIIKGAAADGFELDAGLTGHVQVLATGTDGLQVGPVGNEDNIVLTSAGDITAVSSVKTNLVDSVAGNLTLRPATGKLVLSTFTGAGEGIQAEKNIDMLTNDLAEVGAITGSVGNFTVSSGVTVGDKLTLQAAGGVGGGIDIKPLGGVIAMKGQTDWETNDIINVGSVTSVEYVMTNGVATITTKVDGPSGPSIISDKAIVLSGVDVGAGAVKIKGGALSMENDEIINLAAINGSDLLTICRNLGVDQAGVLEFRELPQTYTFLENAFGGVGTDYMGFGAVVGPGDFWVAPIGPTSKKLRAVSARLIYNAAWSFGGGTAVVEVGTISNILPAAIANFVSLYTLNLNTAGDFYDGSIQELDLLAAAGSSIVVRTTLTGTSSTSVNAELVVNVIMQ